MANGKGSGRRPGKIDPTEWERIFGPKKTFEWQPADDGPRPFFRPAEVIALPPRDE